MSVFDKRDMMADDKDVKSVLVYGDLHAVPDPVMTVIIPVYKRYDTFRNALMSVLEQDFHLPYEVVVVDNSEEFGDTSRNLAFVRQLASPKVCYYVNGRNLGPCGNFNRGILLARGERITFCHDDDALVPDSLSKLYRVSLAYPGKAIFACHHEMDQAGVLRKPFDENRRKLHVFKLRRVCRCSLYNLLINDPPPGTEVGNLFYRSHLVELGAHNPEYYPSFDYALGLNYVRHYGAVYLNSATSVRRMDTNGPECLHLYRLIPEVHKKVAGEVISKLKLPEWISRRVFEAWVSELSDEIERRYNADASRRSRRSLLLYLYRKCLGLARFRL